MFPVRQCQTLESNSCRNSVNANQNNNTFVMVHGEPKPICVAIKEHLINFLELNQFISILTLWSTVD